MLTKPLLAIILATCGVNSSPMASATPTETPDSPPPDDPDDPDFKENVYFCCTDADLKTGSGDGCITIGEKEIDRCSTVLACADGFIKKDGKVTCL
jgi:hypothetical protein